jgi:hypothetical protein
MNRMIILFLRPRHSAFLLDFRKFRKSLLQDRKEGLTIMTTLETH